MGRIERKGSEKEQGKKDKKSIIKEWAKTIIIPIVVALLILQVVRPTLVQ